MNARSVLQRRVAKLGWEKTSGSDMQKAKLFKRPNAQLVCEDTWDGAIEAFNNVDPLERDQYFMVFDQRIFNAEDIDKLQSE